jgi:hypothetical protein
MTGEQGVIGERLELERVKRRVKSREERNRELVSTVEDDISMLMRRRAMLGYGLSRVSDVAPIVGICWLRECAALVSI